MGQTINPWRPASDPPPVGSNGQTSAYVVLLPSNPNKGIHLGAYVAEARRYVDIAGQAAEPSMWLEIPDPATQVVPKPRPAQYAYRFEVEYFRHWKEQATLGPEPKFIDATDQREHDGVVISDGIAGALAILQQRFGDDAIVRRLEQVHRWPVMGVPA